MIFVDSKKPSKNYWAIGSKPSKDRSGGLTRGISERLLPAKCRHKKTPPRGRGHLKSSPLCPNTVGCSLIVCNLANVLLAGLTETR